MDTEKAEFKRLVELMGWSQTETARRLYKTPSAINHLVNPGHPNKPTRTMMQLLKLIIASERPHLLDMQNFELETEPEGAAAEGLRLNPRERELIEDLRQLPPAELEKTYAVIGALLHSGGFKTRKCKR